MLPGRQPGAKLTPLLMAVAVALFLVAANMLAAYSWSSKEEFAFRLVVVRPIPERKPIVREDVVVRIGRRAHDQDNILERITEIAGMVAVRDIARYEMLRATDVMRR
jgi:flagella basal body P-ring formation protein FlgA